MEFISSGIVSVFQLNNPVLLFIIHYTTTHLSSTQPRHGTSHVLPQPTSLIPPTRLPRLTGLVPNHPLPLPLLDPLPLRKLLPLRLRLLRYRHCSKKSRSSSSKNNAPTYLAFASANSLQAQGVKRYSEPLTEQNPKPRLVLHLNINWRTTFRSRLSPATLQGCAACGRATARLSPRDL